MLIQSICLRDLRRRPSIDFALLDDVWCLKESSLSIHTPKSFSHVVSSSFTVCPVFVSSLCSLGSFLYPQNCAILFIEI